jgi:hypothetical protein
MDRWAILIDVIVPKDVRVLRSWLLAVRFTISRVQFAELLFMMEKLWMKKEVIWLSKLLILSSSIKDNQIIWFFLRNCKVRNLNYHL